jgi:putative nucleotidyltransferase with HDIG domain
MTAPFRCALDHLKHEPSLVALAAEPSRVETSGFASPAHAGFAFISDFHVLRFSVYPQLGVRQVGRNLDAYPSAESWFSLSSSQNGPISRVMSVVPNLADRTSRPGASQRADQSQPARTPSVRVGLAVAYVAAVALLWAARPPGGFAILPALVCFAVLTIATRVRFETPFGPAIATQLAFVPLLFALPVAIVPVAVIAALALGRLPDVIAGRATPGSLMRAVSEGWFATGPVAVFAAAGVAPAAAGAGVLAGALVADVAIDAAARAADRAADRGARSVFHLDEWSLRAVDLALAVTGLAIGEEIASQRIATLAPLPLLGLLAVVTRGRTQQVESLTEVEGAYRDTALMLGDVIEADHAYTGQHCKTVVRLATGVADQLGLDATARRTVEFAAALHDIGKITIPREIINKPSKLTPEEWRLIETHTLEGQKLLGRFGGFMAKVGAIVRSHHERWDGAGYPDGLAGEGIPIEARIITACDSWNAMRTDRPYRKAMSYAAACDELRMGAGLQFDPRVAAVLLQILDETEGAAERALAAAAARDAAPTRPHPVRPEAAAERKPVGLARA